MRQGQCLENIRMAIQVLCHQVFLHAAGRDDKVFCVHGLPELVNPALRSDHGTSERIANSIDSAMDALRQLIHQPAC